MPTGAALLLVAALGLGVVGVHETIKGIKKVAHVTVHAVKKVVSR